jgi:hypothetical protein
VVLVAAQREDTGGIQKGEILNIGRLEKIYTYSYRGDVMECNGIGCNGMEVKTEWKNRWFTLY